MNKDDAKRRLTVIENEAKALRKMIEEPDVVALEHGDMLIDNAGGEKLLVVKQQNQKYPVTTFNRAAWTCGCVRGGKHRTREVTRVGNVFDMMKDWDKPLDRFTLNHGREKFHVQVNACNGRELAIKVNNVGWFFASISDVEKIHSNIGRMLAMLKRQNV